MLKVNPVVDVIDEDSITSENDYNINQVRPTQYMRYRIVNVINYDDSNKNTGSFINNVKVKSDAHDKCFNSYFLKDGSEWFPPLNKYNKVEIYSYFTTDEKYCTDYLSCCSDPDCQANQFVYEHLTYTKLEKSFTDVTPDKWKRTIQRYFKK